MSNGTVYVKENFGKGTESYYFTDGKNELSKDFTFTQTVDRIKFLLSVGVDVQSTIMDIDYYRIHSTIR
jgi:hypothetical protein